MSLTLTQLLDELGRAKPNVPIESRATPEDVDSAFEELSSAFSFNRWAGDGGLKLRPLSNLAPHHTAVATRLVTDFQKKIIAGHVRVQRAPNGTWVPVDAEAGGERQGQRPNPCTWRWWKKTHWWGIRLTLNHCAVEWLARGASDAAAALNAFGLARWITTVLSAIAALLPRFDAHDTGVRV
jgi:hypothetical protein